MQIAGRVRRKINQKGDRGKTREIAEIGETHLFQITRFPGIFVARFFTIPLPIMPHPCRLRRIRRSRGSGRRRRRLKRANRMKRCKKEVMSGGTRMSKELKM